MSDAQKRLKRLPPKAAQFFSRAKAALIETFDRRGKPKFYCNACRRAIRHAADSKKHLSLPHGAGEIVGVESKPNNRCPVCGSSDWVRFSIEVLKKHTDIYQSDNVTLVLAPSFSLERSLKHNRDCAVTTGDAARGRAQLQLDVTHLALRNHIYDYVICCHVLEHVMDERAAIEELKRVMRPGGCLLLSMPICTSNTKTIESEVEDGVAQETRFGRRDHVRLYGLDTAERLRGYGLDVTEIVADENWREQIVKYGLSAGDRNFLCSVPSDGQE